MFYRNKLCESLEFSWEKFDTLFSDVFILSHMWIVLMSELSHNLTNINMNCKEL